MLMFNDNKNNTYVQPSSIAYHKWERVHEYSTQPGKSFTLNKVQEAIILALNSMMLATVEMLTKYLNDLSMLEYSVNKELVMRETEVLYKDMYIKKYDFIDVNNKHSEDIIFSLGFRGKGWLGTNQEKPYMTGFIAQNNIITFKKILAANQVLLACDMYKEFPCSLCKMIADSEDDFANYAFRSHALVHRDDSVLILEVIRGEENYIDKAIRKLDRIYNTLNDVKSYNFEKMDLLYVTESEEQMVELIRAINNKRQEGIKLWFTFDSLIVDDHNNRLYTI